MDKVYSTAALPIHLSTCNYLGEHTNLSHGNYFPQQFISVVCVCLCVRVCSYQKQNYLKIYEHGLRSAC